MPFHLLTPKERLRRQQAEEKKLRKLREKRQFDLSIKQAYGLKLPYEWMSHFLRGAGDDKRVRVIEKRELMNYSRIDGNTCNAKGRRIKQKFMAFDIDSDISLAEFVVAAGVTPTYLVGKRLPDGRLQRPHAIFELRFPIALDSDHPDDGMPAFNELYEEIYKRLHAVGYDVDPGQKTTFKNPDFAGWDVDDPKVAPVTLQELQNSLEKSSATVWRFAEAVQAVALVPDGTSVQTAPKPERIVDVNSFAGRNEALFHTIRHKIMDDWANYKGKDIASLSYALLRAMNQAEAFHLADAELRSIAKSHAKFFKNFKGKRNPLRKERNKGAAKHLLLWYMNTRERQSIGAYYTHSLCVARTYDLVHKYKRANPGASITQIAKALVLDRKTVRKYASMLSPGEAAALRKIKELRENVASHWAAHWAAKNEIAAHPREQSTGESGLFRKETGNGDEGSDTKHLKSAIDSERCSVNFPSALTQKLREAQNRREEWCKIKATEPQDSEDFHEFSYFSPESSENSIPAFLL